jgi:hypothetical protein
MSGQSRGSNSNTRGLKFSISSIFLAIGILFAAGCAKIGEPQPPRVLVPEAAADLSVKQVSDSVVLTVSKPTRNTNGSLATDFRSLDVWRLAGKTNTDTLPKDAFAGQASPIISIPAAKFPDYMQGSSFVIEDKLLMPQKAAIYSSYFRYAVVFTNNKNQAAGFSNQVLLKLVPIPLPPALKYEVTESFIHLKWAAPSQNMDESRPARIAGYRIFRSEDLKVPPSLLGTDLITASEFKDANFQFGKTYYYRISVVGSAQNPYAESLSSEGIAVTPKDVFPPQVPGDFHAVLQEGVVYLLWAASQSSDVAGYRIYRLEPGMPEKRLLKPELITIPSFRDSGIKAGLQYEYYLTAVDTYGNESTAVKATVAVP